MRQEMIIKKVYQSIDSLVWYLFLVLLCFISFNQELFVSLEWYFISFCIFTLCTVSSVRMFQGGHYNLKGLVQSKSLLIVYALSLLWLFLQAVLPYETSLVSLTSVNSKMPPLALPTWFKPDYVWSATPALTMQLLWSEITMFSGLILSIVLVSSRQRAKQLLLLVFVVGLIHASTAIVAKYLSIFLVDQAQMDGHFTAARAWFINRNHFAAFIGLTLFSAFSYQLRWIMAFQGQNHFKLLVSQLLSYRVFVLLALLISFVALSLSQSRSGFFAIFFALLTVLMCFGRHSKVSGKRRFLLMPLLLFAIIALVYFGSDLINRLDFQAGLGERANQWAFTWELIKNEWLLGYGGNSYSTVFQATRGDSDFRQVIYNQAHNDYLHIWLEQGLIGLLIWLSILFLTFKRAWKAFCKTSSTLVSAVMIAASVVIFAALLQSLIGFNLQILNIRFYFFVIIALVFAVPTMQHKPV